jgi:hypothetical protein
MLLSWQAPKKVGKVVSAEVAVPKGKAEKTAETTFGFGRTNLAQN